jgi:CBS domain-containing protein
LFGDELFVSDDLDSPLSVLMTQSPVCIGRRVDLATASRLLIAHQISGLPIVDDDDKPIGMFTQAVALHFGANPARTVEEIAWEPALVIAESAALSEVIVLLKRERGERVCVVSSTGALVGILSTLDLLRFVARHGGYLLQIRARP